MLIPIAFILAFVAVVMIVQSLAGAMFSSSDRARLVNRRMTLLQQGMSHDEVYAALVRKPEGGALAAAAPDLYERFFNYCRQAGLSISPERLAAFVGAAAATLWVVAVVLLSVLSGRAFLINALVSLVGAVGLAFTGAYVWLGMRRKNRLKRVEAQMPLALDIVTRAIRAGHPVVSAVQLAAEELGDPLGSEFGLIVDETTYGFEFREALVNFARRTGSQDAHYFAVSVGIQSETGGNLAEILQNLSTVIRDRQTLHLRVKALASEGKMSAVVLSALPILLIAFLLLTQPTFYTSKFSDPIFWPIVGGIVVLYFVGQFMIQRMVNFKY
jgi:tight adherence protein B